MGLVNNVVQAEDLIAEVVTLAALYARRNRDTVGAQKRIFNEHHSLHPADSLRREGATSAASASAAPVVQALGEWVEMQREDGGDSVFLTRPGPWIRGDAVSLNPGDDSGR